MMMTLIGIMKRRKMMYKVIFRGDGAILEYELIVASLEEAHAYENDDDFVRIVEVKND